MRVAVAKGAPENSGARVLVVPVTRSGEQLSPWWGKPKQDWAKHLVAWLGQLHFRADVADTVVCPAPGHPDRMVIFTGLGTTADFEAGRLVKAVSAALRRTKNLAAKSVDLFIQPSHPVDLSDDEQAALATRAVFVGTYELGAFPPPATRHKLESVRLVVPHLNAAVRERVRIENLLGVPMQRARALANEPGNIATPDRIVDYVTKLKSRTGRLQVKIWGPAALRRMKCEALLAVGRGSRQPPRLIEIRHRGDGRSQPVVLVGKTITFDSGGLSLKPAKSMEWMRYDKCGGMAVLAAIEAIHELGLKQPVIALLAVAENMPGGDAMRPGDVVTTRSGKTVEILNTDAEGRLVLADALDVARGYHPRCIVDLATLTGAAGVALGRPYSALFGRPQALVEQLRAAGDRTGEKIWPMPLHPDYDGMLNSSFASMKNTGDGSAGAVAGAMFLQRFVPATIPWCHLDLTNAWLEGGTHHAPSGATLFGAQLLVDWLRHLEQNKKHG